MAVSNKKGILNVSKELYESDEIGNILFKLEVKIYDISYKPLVDNYKIYFTSDYIDEAVEGCELQQYRIEKSTYGFWFVKC